MQQLVYFKVSFKQYVLCSVSMFFSFLFFLTPSSGQSSLFPMEDGFLDDGRGEQTLHSGLGSPHCFSHQNGERVERYSRKVFVGGLPPDIDEGMPRKSYAEKLLLSS